MMPGREPRWSTPSRQQEGRNTERSLLKKRGAKQHPMSGAGRIKMDGSDEHSVYEVKDTQITFTLNGKELGETHRQAAIDGKDAVWIIKFKEGLLPRGHVAEVRIVSEE